MYLFKKVNLIKHNVIEQVQVLDTKVQPIASFTDSVLYWNPLTATHFYSLTA